MKFLQKHFNLILDGRSYESNLERFKFTGKERDFETKYDYFGARYYDARIGRWGSVEPMYNKYLTVTPYNYAANSPLSFADINGLENIVVVGGVDITQNDAYKFINSGLLAANNSSTSGEKTTIVLLTAYMNASDIAGIQSSMGNINLVLANSADELVNYLNSGSINNSDISNDRLSDQITDLQVFGHGVIGKFDFGFDETSGRSNTETSFELDQTKLSLINTNAFSDNSASILYTCNSATTSTTGINIAQLFSTITKGSVSGFSGLASYYDIYSEASFSNKLHRFITGGIGSATKYPTTYKGSEYKTYNNGK